MSASVKTAMKNETAHAEVAKLQIIQDHIQSQSQFK